MAGRLVFCETERELPSLQRGWRTPDPSPTRDAAHLPAWDLKLRIEPLMEEDASTPRNRSTSNSQEMPKKRSSRTPSPSLSEQQLRNDLIQEDMPTPRMSLSPQNLDAKDGTPVLGDNKPTRLDSAKTTEESATQPENRKPQKTSKAQKAKPQAGRVPGEDTKAKAPETDAQSGPQKVPTVSIGSVGHPYTCGEACKYVMKKNRGCKDGSACNRCHLCEWKKRGPRKSKEAHPAELEQSERTKEAPLPDEQAIEALKPEEVKQIEDTCQE